MNLIQWVKIWMWDAYLTYKMCCNTISTSCTSLQYLLLYTTNSFIPDAKMTVPFYLHQFSSNSNLVSSATTLLDYFCEKY